MKVAYGLAVSDTSQQVGQFVWTICRKKDRDIPPKHFGGAIAIETFGGFIPKYNGSIDCLADYRIIRCSNESRKKLFRPKSDSVEPFGVRAPRRCHLSPNPWKV
jgi:hypothetical protein